VSEAKIIIGVDPGLKGAIAFITQEGRCIDVCNFPLLPGKSAARKEYDLHGMARKVRGYLSDMSTTLAVIEEPIAMPNQSCTATATQFTGYGIFLGLLAGCSLIPIGPRSWKRAMGLNDDKSKSLQMASNLFPEFHYDPGAGKTHRELSEGRAEALLLAEYGRRLYGSHH
jgi:Holliday junction resolvasome RuvABC endonuclease subunit